jgi:DNA-binding response OmpR family regulator
MSGRRKKILLVDDSKTVLMMQKIILKSEDCDFVIANDGKEGVERALAELPDLILMDVVMPNLNGFEACKQLRQHATTRDTPIIIVTTRSEADKVQTGFESGCNDYLTKPINAAELVAKVRNLLGTA